MIQGQDTGKELQLIATSNTRMRKICDHVAINLGMVVGAGGTGLSISEPSDIWHHESAQFLSFLKTMNSKIELLT